jgi:hypothetical protein
MNAKKKFEKKKARERAVQKKLELRRDAVVKSEQERTALRRRIKKIERLRAKMPEVNDFSDETLLNLSDDAIERLELNARILQALEDDYEAEMANKAALNKELEAAGANTLDEKLELMHQQVVKEQKEIAQVEVIKAPMAKVENSEEN